MRAAAFNPRRRRAALSRPVRWLPFYGQNLSSTTAQAGSLPLPTSLGGVTLAVTDSAGVQRAAPLLYVSPNQINFFVPENLSTGNATFALTGAGPAQNVTAGISSSGTWVVQHERQRFRRGGRSGFSGPAWQSASAVLVPVFQCGGTGCVAVPIGLGVDRPVYVSFYGTGIRNRSSLANVTVTINGVSVPALYAGAAPDYVGLDQVNVGLPLTLRGSGECSVVVSVDGQTSNAVTINIE